MSLKTYPRGLNEPDHVRHVDPTRVFHRLLPGDAVTHVRYAGHGIVISVSETQHGVMWTIEPNDPFANFVFPIVKRVTPGLIRNQLVGIQPMPIPSSKVFYIDHTYGFKPNASEKP